MCRKKAVEKKKHILCTLSIVSSTHHSLTLTICDTRGRGVMMSNWRPTALHLVPEHRSLIVQKTSIQRDIPWHLPCSGRRQNKARRVPTTGIFDKYLSRMDSWECCTFTNSSLVGFPQTFGRGGTWKVIYVWISLIHLALCVTHNYWRICQKQQSRGRGLVCPLARQKWDKSLERQGRS